MRVLCIDDDPFDGDIPPEGPFLVKYGEVYEVIRELGGGRDVRYYELTIQPGIGYRTDLFIPISEIDETEEAKHRELKKIRESLEV